MGAISADEPEAVEHRETAAIWQNLKRGAAISYAAGRRRAIQCTVGSLDKTAVRNVTVSSDREGVENF